MTSETFTIKNDKLEYGQIILGHIKEILKISRCNLYEEEVNHRYQTAILTLSDTLYSYYDDEMIKAEKRFIECKQNPKYKMEFKHYREFFRALLGLTKRVDYFKSAVYGEDKDELVQEYGEDSEKDKE